MHDNHTFFHTKCCYYGIIPSILIDGDLTIMMRKFHTEFTAKNLTGNAGLLLLGKFAEKLRLQKMLGNQISIKRAAQATYNVQDTIMMLMFGALVGAKHISHMAMLRYDEALRSLFCWDKFPDDTTFGRIFKLFSQKNCCELSEVESHARTKIWSKKWFGKITLDMDSTVRGVYGDQEGAAKGYNSKKKGQKSYHPLLCFIAENRECFHSWFRSGNAYSANGSVEFMKECFAKLPKRVWKVFVRADSAFFNGDLFDILEGKGCQYLIKVRMKGLVILLETQSWRQIKNRPGYESCQFDYKCSGWKRTRTFVAIRKVVEHTEEDDLFGIAGVRYEYFCYASNLKLSPWATHKRYGQRSTSENWIEWCKNQMASGSILTQSFWANSAIFQTCILGYNLMVWMMWLNNEDGFNEEPNTVRMILINVPARMTYRGRQWTLRLPWNYPYRKRWEKLEASIYQFSFA